jgi:hypothetical protein
VLEAKGTAIANRVQDAEDLLKIDVAGPGLLSAGRIGKLNVPEYVARPG